MNYKGKEALLFWCKTNTSGYPEVVVSNFNNSWKDGLAYCALIHKFHPEALQFDSLSKDRPLDNLETAFAEAAKLGIPRLLEPTDMMIEPMPDDRSIMTYLSQMYHVFERNAHPGMGIANITMEGPAIPPLSSSQSETNLTKQPFVRPKFNRSVSTNDLPKPNSSGPQLQQRIPPLLTKSGTFKYVPTAKKAAAQVPEQQVTPPVEQPPPLSLDQESTPAQEPAPIPSSPAPVAASASVAAPTPVTTPTPVVVKAVTTSPTISASPATSPAPQTNGTATPNGVSSPTKPVDIPTKPGDSPTTNGAALSRTLSSSAPIFPRAHTSPAISMTSYSSSVTKPSPSDTPAKSSDDAPAPKATVLMFNYKTPTSPTQSPSPMSPSPSPVPSSPSPSPTPQKTTIKLSAKSAGEISTAKRVEDIPKQPSTPPLQSRQPDTKLKRSQSVTNVAPKNWVNTIKGHSNFIRITDQKVEIKKVEVEGPTSPNGSDDESSKSQGGGTRNFMVDKVSSSSRDGWLAKRKKREEEEEEEEDEYEYIDDDPNRMHEPVFNPNFKPESCLIRSASTGKLAMPTTLHRDRGLKKVSFKDYFMSTESHESEAPPPAIVQKEEEPPLAIVTTTTTTITTGSTELMKDMEEAQVKANATIKDLEKSRDAAVFHRDEIAARYAELEQRYKEERAANEAMERETVDLHQKLAAIQEQTEAKFNQKVSDMSQKIADKDREILKLRMQNTTMKKKVEERDRDIEKLKRETRSLSPLPEIPPEDLEADNECRQTWEQSERQHLESSSPPKTISVHSYGGLKISVDTSKLIDNSPRSATASPRFDLVKQFPDSPFSPTDLVRRTSTPPLLSKATSPTKSESPQVEIAKVYVYGSRPQTPTKPGDSKYMGVRPQTPTKVEITKKPESGSSHSRSASLDQLPRADSQTRITYQIPSPKSPEPVKVVLSPKNVERRNSGGMTVDTSKPVDAKDGKSAPGTPRLHAESGGLDPKPAKEETPATKLESKQEYRPGTLRTEISKPSIIFSPPTSPSPRASPSPSPKPTTIKYTPPIRHSSNPHSQNPNPSPISPRASSNPSPSSSPAPGQTSSSLKATTQFSSRTPSSGSPSPSPVPPSPSPNPSSSSSSGYSPNPTPTSSASAKDKDKDHAKGFFSFITRARSNTLPSEMPAGYGGGEANGRVEHHTPPVSLMSPRGSQKIEVGTAKESVSELLEDDNKPMPINRIGRSYSLSSITPPKPSYAAPPSSQGDSKPTWLVNLGRKIKPNDDSILPTKPKNKTK